MEKVGWDFRNFGIVVFRMFGRGRSKDLGILGVVRVVLMGEGS